MCGMKANGACGTGLPCKAAALLRAPLPTKPCPYSVNTVIYKVILRRGEPGCCNLHPALTSLSGSLDYASGSSEMSPRSFLSTTAHKFHGNKSSYTIVRRTALLTAPAGIRRLGSLTRLRVDSQSQECFLKAIPYSNLCRQERINSSPRVPMILCFAVLSHIPAGHHRKVVTQVPELNSHWIWIH